MPEPIVSIIIPMYNAEKYVKECLNSIQSQSLPTLEIICVDDGSTDKTLQIINEYAEKDERFVIIKQKNSYAGIARNNGLKVARGKYVLFLDADDFFDAELIEKTVKKAEDTNAEIIVYNGYYYNNETNEKEEVPWLIIKDLLPDKEVFSSEDCPKYIFNFTTPAPWNKLYKRSFIEEHRLQFQDTKRTNDLFFTYSAFYKAKKITILNEKLVYYRTGNKYSLQGTKAETILDSYKALQKLMAFMKTDDQFDLFEQSFINMSLGIFRYNLQTIQDRSLQKDYFYLLKNDIYKQLGILGRPESYYFKNYQDMIRLMDYSYEEYFHFYEELLSKIKEYDEVIIYGSGFISGQIINYLSKMDSKNKIIGIAVTNKVNNPDYFKRFKVQEISAFIGLADKALVIVAVSNRYQDEISGVLKMLGYKNVIKYKD